MITRESQVVNMGRGAYGEWEPDAELTSPELVADLLSRHNRHAQASAAQEVNRCFLLRPHQRLGDMQPCTRYCGDPPREALDSAAAHRNTTTADISAP